MGALGGLTGLSGGQSGTGIAGPSGIDMQQVATPGQIAGAYDQTQKAMDQQQSLLKALREQGGIQNQNQVYGQLQGVANGTGPNPAQAQYQQNVQDLAKQQSGAISSIQGISPALAARMMSQQGSAAMQNAAAAGAVNTGNQQLGAMTAAGNLASTQSANQIGQTNANVGSMQAEQGALLNAATGQNATMANMQGNINNSNSGLAQTVMGGTQKIIGQAGTGAGLFAAHGGQVVRMADGGQAFGAPSGPQSRFGQFLVTNSANPIPLIDGGIPRSIIPQEAQQKSTKAAPAQAIADKTGQMAGGAGDTGAGIGAVPMMAASGGKVPALVSPGEMYIPPQNVGKVAQGANPMREGERIPGTPKVKGNSYANDTVPKNLDVGGVVIPNSIMQSKNPAKGAQDFVAKIIAKRKARK